LKTPQNKPPRRQGRRDKKRIKREEEMKNLRIADISDSQILSSNSLLSFLGALGALAVYFFMDGLRVDHGSRQVD
jgi:hypothetical protein